MYRVAKVTPKSVVLQLVLSEGSNPEEYTMESRHKRSPWGLPPADGSDSGEYLSMGCGETLSSRDQLDPTADGVYTGISHRHGAKPGISVQVYVQDGLYRLRILNPKEAVYAPDGYTSPAADETRQPSA
jgi:hypothetical protein